MQDLVSTCLRDALTAIEDRVEGWMGRPGARNMGHRASRPEAPTEKSIDPLREEEREDDGAVRPGSARELQPAGRFDGGPFSSTVLPSGSST